MRRFSPDELAEIRTLYRNAASRKKQIGILADLYACPRQDIERALGLPVTPKIAQLPKPRLRWTLEMEQQLLDIYRNTHDPEVIAAAMELPPLNIRKKDREAEGARGDTARAGGFVGLREGGR